MIRKFTNLKDDALLKNTGDKTVGVVPYGSRTSGVAILPNKEFGFEVSSASKGLYYFKQQTDDIKAESLYQDSDKPQDFSFKTVPADFEEVEEYWEDAVINESPMFKFTNITKRLERNQRYATTYQNNVFQVGDTVFTDSKFGNDAIFLIEENKIVASDKGYPIHEFLKSYNRNTNVSLYIVEPTDTDRVYTVVDRSDGVLNSLFPIRIQCEDEGNSIRLGNETQTVKPDDKYVLFTTPLYHHEYKVEMIPKIGYVAYCLDVGGINIDGESIMSDDFKDLSSATAYFFKISEMSTFHIDTGGEDFACKVLDRFVSDGDLIPPSGGGVSLELTHYSNELKGQECIFEVTSDSSEDPSKREYEATFQPGGGTKQPKYYVDISDWYGDDVTIGCFIRERSKFEFVKAESSENFHLLHHVGGDAYDNVLSGESVVVGDRYQISNSTTPYSDFDYPVDIVINTKTIREDSSSYYEFTLTRDMVNSGNEVVIGVNIHEQESPKLTFTTNVEGCKLLANTTTIDNNKTVNVWDLNTEGSEIYLHVQGVEDTSKIKIMFYGVYGEGDFTDGKEIFVDNGGFIKDPWGTYETWYTYWFTDDCTITITQKPTLLIGNGDYGNVEVDIFGVDEDEVPDEDNAIIVSPKENYTLEIDRNKYPNGYIIEFLQPFVPSETSASFSGNFSGASEDPIEDKQLQIGDDYVDYVICSPSDDGQWVFESGDGGEISIVSEDGMTDSRILKNSENSTLDLILAIKYNYTYYPVGEYIQPGESVEIKPYYFMGQEFTKFSVFALDAVNTGYEPDIQNTTATLSGEIVTASTKENIYEETRIAFADYQGHSTLLVQRPYIYEDEYKSYFNLINFAYGTLTVEVIDSEHPYRREYKYSKEPMSDNFDLYAEGSSDPIEVGTYLTEGNTYKIVANSQYYHVNINGNDIGESQGADYTFVLQKSMSYHGETVIGVD